MCMSQVNVFCSMALEYSIKVPCAATSLGTWCSHPYIVTYRRSEGPRTKAIDSAQRIGPLSVNVC